MILIYWRRKRNLSSIHRQSKYMKHVQKINCNSRLYQIIFYAPLVMICQFHHVAPAFSLRIVQTRPNIAHLFSTGTTLFSIAISRLWQSWYLRLSIFRWPSKYLEHSLPYFSFQSPRRFITFVNIALCLSICSIFNYPVCNSCSSLSSFLSFMYPFLMVDKFYPYLSSLPMEAPFWEGRVGRPLIIAFSAGRRL